MWTTDGSVCEILLHYWTSVFYRGLTSGWVSLMNSYRQIHSACVLPDILCLIPLSSRLSHSGGVWTLDRRPSAARNTCVCSCAVSSRAHVKLLVAPREMILKVFVSRRSDMLCWFYWSLWFCSVVLHPVCLLYSRPDQQHITSQQAYQHSELLLHCNAVIRWSYEG